MKLSPLLSFVFVLLSSTAAAQEWARHQDHFMGMPKLMVQDLPAAQAFYEKTFGLKELSRLDYAPEVFVESFLGFNASDAEEGAQLALFEPRQEKPLPKSRYPVVLFYTPDYDTVAQRLADADHSVRHLDESLTGRRIAITQDPSGNGVEIVEREGPEVIGGSKLIVDSREKAEQFYVDILQARIGNRYQTDAYDEVILHLGEGPFLALFEPKDEKPLKKTVFPVTALYTMKFDEVLERIEEKGVDFRWVDIGDDSLKIIAFQDPAGNSIELVGRK